MSGDWLAEVPKIELHLHIEGAMPYSVLTELVRKYAIDPFTPELEAIRNPAPQAEFLDFHKLWLWKTGLLREYDDFRLVAEASARHLAGQNIRYVEAFFCPADFRRWKLQTPRLIEAIRSGLS
jgi:adenosine deaminase